MRIGVLVRMDRDKDIDTQFAEVKEMGMSLTTFISYYP